MQIHELNNFTGTLGSGAYLAIDDGTDTGKISSQGLLAATEARIDNIIAGPAPSAEEIVDARLGADGVTYPSLGDAIRDQFTDVKSAIKEIANLEVIPFTDGHYVKTYQIGGTIDLTDIITSNNYRYAIINCTAGDKFTLTLRGGGSSAYGWTFASSSYEVLDASGASVQLDHQLITAPANSAYLVLNDQNTGGICYIGESAIADMQSNIVDIQSVVNNTLDFYKRISFANGVYANIGNYDSAITSKATRIYGQIALETEVYNVTINPTSSSFNFQYAFFDKNNTKLISNNSWNTQAVTYRSSVGIKTIRIDVRRSNDANISPTTDTGIVISVNNSVNIEQINAKLSEAFKDIDFNQQLTKLTIMTHNVGKFNYGNSGGYSGSDVDAKVLEWKNMYGKYKPDILLGQENVPWFDSAETISPSTVLFTPLFPHYIGNGTYATFIRSKLPLVQTFDISLSAEVSGTTYTRTATCAVISVGNKSIVIVSTHLSPGHTADAETARMAQASQLITALEDYDTVIIGGDFNSSEETFFNLFKADGYTCVNHGYWGVLETISGASIDNIIVKGAVPYNILCSSSDACTSDHYPVVAELYIN